MTGYSQKAPVAEYIEHQEDRLTYRSNEFPVIGRCHRIRLAMAQAGGKTVPVRVHVEQVQRLEGGGFACTGLMERKSLVEKPPLGASQPGRPAMRRFPRVGCELALRCPDLPGHRAMARDVSPVGMQLSVDGPVSEGLVVLLEVEREDFAPLRCRGRVVWCSRWAGEDHRVGVEFLAVDLVALAELL